MKITNKSASALKKRPFFDENFQFFKKSKTKYYGEYCWNGYRLKHLFSMVKDFSSERKYQRELESNSDQLDYFTIDTQKTHEVIIAQNKFSYVDGTVLDGEYIYCLTADESPKLICSPEGHHSYLANGKKVLAAGTFIFDEGKLLMITNNSGHYKPDDVKMLDFIGTIYKASNNEQLIYVSYMTEPKKFFFCKNLFLSNNFTNPILSDDLNFFLEKNNLENLLYSDAENRFLAA